jgi:hypothetical protein
MNLLTILPHNSELQVITAPPLISTLYKPLLQTLSLLYSAESSLAVPWQRPLTVKILQFNALTSLLLGEYPAASRTELPTKYQLRKSTDPLLITFQHRPQKTPFPLL